MNIDTAYAALPLPIRNKLKRTMMALLKPRLKTFYREYVQEGKLVFDIGANDGDYSEIFMELGGTVISIDPQPVSVRSLRQKFRGNKKVKVLPYGVGKKTGKVDFYISSFNNPNSSFSKDFIKKSRYSYRKWDTVKKVNMVTLNQLIKTYGLPDFCKVDVEGYEWEILSVLKKPIPTISFEFITEMNEKTFKIIQHLDTLGTPKYNYCLGMKYKYELSHWVKGKEMIRILETNEKNNWQGDLYVTYTL